MNQANKLVMEDPKLIPVLDKGYVRLVDHMGSDLSVVNAARASYSKESEEMTHADAKLLQFLARESHLSPFRHAFITFEMKAPLLTARQIWKYVVGSTHVDPMNAWNEACLPGDQWLMTTEGKISVKDFYTLHKNNQVLPELFSFDVAGDLIPSKVKDVWVSSDIGDIFTVVTENGTSLSATSNHKLPTQHFGDKELIMLEPGDTIFTDVGGERVPSKVIDVFHTGKQDIVYDIEMEESPYFIASGILVHNSRRYITSEEEFYQIKHTEWRSKPEHSKQGSGEPVSSFTGAFFSEAFSRWAKEGHELYQAAMDHGICAEQARVFLPAYSLYVTWRWSMSLQALAHFLRERLADDAQLETQKYAQACMRLSHPLFPQSFTALGLV